MASAEKNFGADHPSTAVSYSNLALVLQDLGDYAGAKGLLERAVASAEKNFGADHPTTAVRYFNMATVLYSLAAFGLAYDYIQKAAAVFNSKLPPEHPYHDLVRSWKETIEKAMDEAE